MIPAGFITLPAARESLLGEDVVIERHRAFPCSIGGFFIISHGQPELFTGGISRFGGEGVLDAREHSQAKVCTGFGHFADKTGDLLHWNERISATGVGQNPRRNGALFGLDVATQ